MNTFKAFEKHELKNQAVILGGAEEATAGRCVSVGYNRYVQFDSDCKSECVTTYENMRWCDEGC